MHLWRDNHSAKLETAPDRKYNIAINSALFIVHPAKKKGGSRDPVTKHNHLHRDKVPEASQ
jgi:hypothetical protein